MSVLKVENLNAWFGDNHVVKNISLDYKANTISAIIGPSGCGKSTFVRCLNRIHEEVPSAKVSGAVYLQGKNIYGPGVDAVTIRKNIGMVFQKPTPFPAMSVLDNVLVGLRFQGMCKKTTLMEIAEACLKKAALWDEVKDKLNQPGTSLSGGQQQRLCIARTLAVNPPVLLMDEPTSALDPISTAKIEELMDNLKNEYTVIIVTHNMQQAARIADYTSFFILGDLIEHGPSSEIFTNPKNKKTEDYVTGRFG
ncbi:MAG: phosphate ABC transporter ATP-binding protein [Bdellovibrionales bacterium RIFOXYB1_FULL_37_110]|nr:MAG: phosphate ABC transporter ATP-binding protein [Bdellovibrionales bacterium RIFOXYC1_FULL_37_79]OFZ54499.1 MAG: phosphate ABC transporter ATP-binding protein [Bdellovibrionales bacterium RIFOXYB2_FULL_36_6]OFZ59137.1 MAG: phosphate ABC transporter ATP-binding protein [Bdellovibrionales bacterium RIFOXYB1_FULL_37_110]OFZ64142.1 MAG: phosphate ABC transporter ATP-binding protein [Bdellovibrionales bacterium RIFOXYD1_FULL_36_51]OFZ71223.1 MAG: phosphate ABC transporter ATP-binding protein [